MPWHTTHLVHRPRSLDEQVDRRPEGWAQVFELLGARGAADALADPYFGALHDDNDEPDAAPFDFSFEDTRDGMPLDEKALRKEIWASSPERR